MLIIINILKQIKHHIWLIILYFEGIKDRHQMIKDFPQFKGVDLLNTKNALLKSYLHYTSTVSTPQMAISFKTASFLYNLCFLFKPKSILDLGSGYSTYVFAKYVEQVNKKIQLLSIDDDPKWLNKSKSYIKQNRLSARFFNWKKFKKLNKIKSYDLILYDLGSMDTRKNEFSFILKYANQNSIIIVDDCQFLDNYRLVKKHTYNEQLKFYSLREYTKDNISRFASMLVKHA